MEFNGLPLHPLVVHAVVVLGPLAGVTGLVYAFVPRWRWLLRWPLVALAVLVAAASLVAVQAGESLLDSRPELAPLVEDHQDWGELLRSWSLAFVPVSLLAAWALRGRSPLVSGRGGGESRMPLGWVASLLLLVGSVGLVVLVFLAGDSGSRAVWG
ncbi:hypothetical protein EXE58_13975 [Nocardioides seonyuensis]|uniref:DUF2231 domain-containing protein n=1 Tax=Nocardioides seonyuensis TaxID=2518371 RepID=A0A4P7IIA2_9ACTN|nr:DUF2231 domain-containing protein [Nocardioides seonyuensis]QBX56463.1 hypothetical protein EXE58_13975 [Nocardioides seonyuensis]